MMKPLKGIERLGRALIELDKVSEGRWDIKYELNPARDAISKVVERLRKEWEDEIRKSSS